MKKKLIIGAVLATAIITIPTTVFASEVIHLSWTKNIYNVSDSDSDSRTTVSTFDDRGNKCYVINHDSNGVGDGKSVSISCVKQN